MTLMLRIIPPARKASLSRNVLMMYILQFANYIIPFATYPYLTHVLGPNGFGELGISIVVAGYLTILSDWGTNYSGPRRIAQLSATNADISQSFWEIFWLRLLLTALSLFLLFAGMLALQVRSEFRITMYAAWLIVFGNSLCVNWFLQGLERLDLVAKCVIAGRLITIPSTFWFVTTPEDVWIAALIQGVCGLAIGFISLLIAHRTALIKRVELSSLELYEQFISGFQVFLSVASHGIYSSSALICLQTFGTSLDVGLFSAVDRLRIAAQSMVTPLQQSLYPRISSLVQSDPQKARLSIMTTVLVQCSVMLVVSFLLFLNADNIVIGLMGDKFGGAVNVLKILAFIPFVFAFNNILGLQVLMAHDQNKQFSVVAVITLIINLATMPVLVYIYGTIGAALGIALTELSITIGYSYATRRFIFRIKH